MTLINYKGKQVEAEEVEVLTEKEQWNEYQLADGTSLKMKLTLIEVFKATEEKAPDGSALYITKSQQVINTREAN